MQDHLVLWGHSLQDYQEMFALTDAELEKKFVDCGSGPSSFNVQMKQRGHTVISCDEQFALEQSVLETKIKQQFDEMLQQVQANRDEFIWETQDSPRILAEKRTQGLRLFFEDYARGKQEGRYLPDPITALPLEDYKYDIALSSHYLFTSQDHEAIDFHIAAILEMCRVAQEARIFPLLDSLGEVSPLLGPVLLSLQQHNLGVEVRQVPYQFQKKGNAMLRVWAQQCEVTE